MPWRFDYRVVWPDGSVHWLEGRGGPVRDHNGVIIGTTGITVNVDERREAERDGPLSSKRNGHAASIGGSDRGPAAPRTVDPSAVARCHLRRSWPNDRAPRHGGSGRAVRMVRHRGRLGRHTRRPHIRGLSRRRDGAVHRDPTGQGLARDRGGPDRRVLPRASLLEDRAIRYRHFRDGQAHTAFVVVPINAAEDAAAAVARPSDCTTVANSARRNAGTWRPSSTRRAQALQRVVLYELAQLNRARLRTTLDISEQLAQTRRA